MKLIFSAGIIFAFLALPSCNSNKPVKKDFANGAIYKADRLSSDDVEMTVNGIPSTNNEFDFDDEVEFIFNNVQGLTQIKGKVYPGMSFFIIENGLDTVMRRDDIFIDFKDGIELISPNQLSTFFMNVLPNLNDHKYEVFITLWDKKSPGTITYQMPFTANTSEILSINSNEINCKEIHLWNATTQQIVSSKNIKMSDDYILILNGLNGLEILDGKIYPAMELGILDKNGKAILYSENVYLERKDIGVDSEIFRTGKLPITITFPQEKIDNPCRLEGSLTDLKNPERKISISADLIIN